MAKKGRKSGKKVAARKVSSASKTVRSNVKKIRSRLTPAGKKQAKGALAFLDELAKAVANGDDCTGGNMGKFFVKKSGGK